MLLSTAVVEYIRFKRLAQKSPKTLRAYQSDLRLFVRHVVYVTRHDRVTDFTATMVEDFLGHEHDRDLKVVTVARRQTALKGFAAWGLRRGYWRTDPTLDLEPITRPETLPRPFDPDERDRLMALTLPDDERALRGLLYYVGPRDEEVCAILLEDLTRPTSTKLGRVLLRGKGQRERSVGLHQDLWPLLEPIVTRREDRRTGGWLFEQDNGRPWSTAMIRRRVARWGAACDPPVAKCTPHRWRHLAATDLLEQTDDLAIVQTVLGHKSPATTRLYTKITSARMDAAIRKMLSFPPPAIRPELSDSPDGGAPPSS